MTITRGSWRFYILVKASVDSGANDHGRVTPFLVHLKFPLENNSGRVGKKEGRRNKWRNSQICLFTPKRKKCGSDYDYLELARLRLLPFGRVEDKKQREIEL